MVDYLGQRCKPAIMVEASLLMGEQSGKRRCPVNPIRRAVGLKTVDAHIRRRMRVSSGLGKQRRDVAPGALRLGVEEHFAAFRGEVERPLGWLRGGDRQLVGMQRRQLWCNPIFGRVNCHVTKTGNVLRPAVPCRSRNSEQM